ncbi:MAG: HDIG domain-containing protein [Bacteroidales bacterium]|nr:HDIG domain-containing protein [Bacteroidales bacterium]MBR4146776.1 HDIG domain-containing protein [Bacteroidales bacterium]
MGKLKDFVNSIRHRYYELAKVLMFLLAIVVVYWQMPRVGKFRYEYQLYKPWQHETLYAPIDFPIYKDADMLKQESDEIVKSIKPIFKLDSEATRQAKSRLDESFEQQWRAHDGMDAETNKRTLMELFDQVQNRGVVAYDKALSDFSAETPISLVRDQTASTVAFGNLYTMNSAREAVEQWMEHGHPGIDVQLLSTLLLNVLQPNVVYDISMTQQEQDKALSKMSLTYGMVQKDELIITEGEIVDDNAFAILNSLQKEYATGSFAKNDSTQVQLSQLFLVALLFVMLALYLKALHNKDVFAELSKINLILLLMVVMIIPSYWIMKLHPSFILMMPVVMLTMVMVTFFTSALAFTVQVFTVLLISMAVPNPFQYIFMQLVASMIVIFILSHHRSRRHYFISSLLLFVVYFVVYLAFAFLSSAAIDWSVVGLLALNALFTMLALPVIFLFEKMFRMTTSLTLMELNNTNTPLLRKLAQTAPGTFQHSIQVANLCDEVLYAIGGDSLLARTGALYHDIGKMKNPMYFTENQHGGYNSHNDISNVESAQIIISHVLDGIEMAKKARLPEQVVEFIRTHHGTRRTEYFYIMEKREHPDEEVDPADFTYHGPIPFSRETAVLMICDSVEAASRSLKEPDENNISNLVDNIIQKQTDDGQFQNVDLTLRDFTTIKKVLKKKLMSIYHIRIAYPEK